MEEAVDGDAVEMIEEEDIWERIHAEILTMVGVVMGWCGDVMWYWNIVLPDFEPIGAITTNPKISASSPLYWAVADFLRDDSDVVWWCNQHVHGFLIRSQFVYDYVDMEEERRGSGVDADGGDGGGSAGCWLSFFSTLWEGTTFGIWSRPLPDGRSQAPRATPSSHQWSVTIQHRIERVVYSKTVLW